MELPPGLFHPHYPLHTLKVTDISLKINCCNAKIKRLNMILSDENKKRITANCYSYICDFWSTNDRQDNEPSSLLSPLL